MPIAYKITTEQKDEIRNAPPSITTRELAERFGVSQGTILYHRRKGAHPTRRVRAVSTRDSNPIPAPAPAPVPDTSSSDRLARALTAHMTEGQVDAMWCVLPLVDKLDLMRGLLWAKLESAR